jgi:hyaluronoglucosaminidase
VRIGELIEGFYGPPRSQEERLDLLRFAAAAGFNTWVHAPKDDPYHRRLWREP